MLRNELGRSAAFSSGAELHHSTFRRSPDCFEILSDFIRLRRTYLNRFKLSIYE